MQYVLQHRQAVSCFIHIGVDTVKLDGKGFTKKVSDGAKVHAGDVLIEADLDTIRQQAILRRPCLF